MDSDSDGKHKWKKEETRKLIAAVVSNHNLWGTSGRSANQQQRKRGWTDVSSQFENISSSECRKKWQILRAQQRRIIRSGISNNTKWPHFADLPPLQDDNLYDARPTTSSKDCSQRESIPSGDEWTHFGEFVARKLRDVADQQVAQSIKERICSYLSICTPVVHQVLSTDYGLYTFNVCELNLFYFNFQSCQSTVAFLSSQSSPNLVPIKIVILGKDGRPVSEAEALKYLEKVPRLVNGTLVFPTIGDDNTEQK